MSLLYQANCVALLIWVQCNRKPGTLPYAYLGLSWLSNNIGVGVGTGGISNVGVSIAIVLVLKLLSPPTVPILLPLLARARTLGCMKQTKQTAGDTMVCKLHGCFMTAKCRKPS